MRTLSVFALVFAFAGATGCGGGDKGPKKHDITGTVSYNGQTISEGDITLLPADGSVGGEGGKIKDGKYAMKAREGKNKVQIMATRAVPGKKGPMGEDLVEQYIPEKYNEKTTIEVTVESGKTEYNFDLPK
jgi:hypothetical protein